MPNRGVFPTRENCDINDPEERFLWMFAALPGVNGGQFILPIDYFRKVSERIGKLGAMAQCEKCGHVKEPELEYVPPAANEPNWATSAGKWVQAGSVSAGEKEERLAANGLAQMGHQQKVELFKALKAWRSKHSIPETKAGEVVRKLSDPQRLLLLRLLEQRDAA